jgi:excisionase family DNA binding protein
LLDIGEMPELLNVSISTTYRLMQQGLPYLQDGSHRRFDEAEVMAWLRAQRAEESGPA